jgi:probable phosphoglycerate mutase
MMIRLSVIVAAVVVVLAFTTPAAEAVRLYLVRHGDPEYVDLLAGLTEHGKAEGRALAPYLATLGITHAYTSPMQRAKLTAKLALADIPKFSPLHGKNFEKNVGIEDWCAEKQTWQASESKLAQALLTGTVIWDLPAPMIRNQLADTVKGTSESLMGWVHASPDHGQWIDYFGTFCRDADEFLARHGIVRELDGPNYRMSPQDAANPDKRNAQIVIFGHGGTFLILLAHLLQIPLPSLTASMWLPPSSVTTILFEEHTGNQLGRGRNKLGESPQGGYCSSDSTEDGSIVLTPRAIGIGGVSHLAQMGLDIALSKYEQSRRPSGLKHNYW